MTSARHKGRWVGAGLMVLLLVAVLLVLWFRHTFHRVEKTLYLPPSGEAAYNPLYALAKTLEADGVKVDARQRLMLDDNPLAPATRCCCSTIRARCRRRRPNACWSGWKAAATC